MGMGFTAFVVGAVLSVALFFRLGPRIQALGSPVVAFVLQLFIEHLWVVAVLPLFCYGAARIIELRPWSTAIGAMLVGEGFLLALRIVSTGLEGFTDPGVHEGGQLSMLVLGVLASRWAVGKGRAAAVRAQEASAGAANAKKSQYDEFAAEAERLASMHEANPIATAGATTPAANSAVTIAPLSSEGASSPGPQGSGPSATAAPPEPAAPNGPDVKNG